MEEEDGAADNVPVDGSSGPLPALDCLDLARLVLEKALMLRQPKSRDTVGLQRSSGLA